MNNFTTALHIAVCKFITKRKQFATLPVFDKFRYIVAGCLRPVAPSGPLQVLHSLSSL